MGAHLPLSLRAHGILSKHSGSVPPFPVLAEDNNGMGFHKVVENGYDNELRVIHGIE